MKVRLVSYSKPSEFQTYDEPLKSTQDLIAYCAKVSNPNHQINTATHEKLLNYLVKHKHWSPFEMASACLEIQTTRDIAHQIVRHRSFSFQEFSQRYANPDEQGDMFEYSEARLQDPKNRQNSIKTDDGKLQLEWEQAQRRIGVLAKKEYDWAIKKGIAKEQARKVLPEGITKTTLYMNGTIRSWIHYVELRGANGTQQEHMDIAHACADAIAKIFPNIEVYANGEN
jgi:thymidylate synthase (FAD)